MLSQTAERTRAPAGEWEPGGPAPRAVPGWGAGVEPGWGGAPPGNRGPGCDPPAPCPPLGASAFLLPASHFARRRRDYRQFVSPNLSLAITFGDVSLAGI